MPAKNEDLHGNVPDNSTVALLIIDVINDLEFEGGAELLEQATPMAERIAKLKRRAKQAGSPKVASERLGHSGIAITLDHYAHVMPGQQQEASDALEELLFG